ncbi:MAG TPA: glutamyl-tRNA reductase [Candidatus Omnitrophota bacterium]|nr:glutamyl-tRNA reductase [Candidatus Omnitrophota bacterium]
MKIQLIGLNHKTAPIEIREKVSFSSEKLAEALLCLKRYEAIEEDVILSTCNRTEIYAAVRDPGAGSESLWRFIADRTGLSRDQICRYFYLLNDKDALGHLFKVAASLDSMIVGETQVFGQVKDAYFQARQANTIGRSLDAVFEEAIRVGKKVRTETQIGKGAVSTTTAAIELAKKIFDSLEGKRVLIIGAGKIGEMTVKNLYSRGVSTVLVANRTFARAQELAGAFGGQAVRFDRIAECMLSADIIISSTSAPHYVVNRQDVLALMSRRPHDSLFFIDLGMPRNIDPQVNRIENVYLYNIDDLASVRDANIQERISEARKAEQIIALCLESVSSRFNLGRLKEQCTA